MTGSRRSRADALALHQEGLQEPSRWFRGLGRPVRRDVEQLSGFYIVDSHDVDDLLQVCSMLLDDAGTSGGSTIEVRAVVAQDGHGA